MLANFVLDMGFQWWLGITSPGSGVVSLPYWQSRLRSSGLGGFPLLPYRRKHLHSRKTALSS